jgi:hypothetical protein
MLKMVRRYFLIVLAVAILGLVQLVEAQSGRRRPDTGAASISGTAPTVAAGPAKAAAIGDEPPGDPNAKITSILVAG